VQLGTINFIKTYEDMEAVGFRLRLHKGMSFRRRRSIDSPIQLLMKFYTCKFVDPSAVHVNFALPRRF
jgi:hypothetical protein